MSSMSCQYNAMSCESHDMDVMSMKWLGCHVNDMTWLPRKCHGLDVMSNVFA